MKTKFKPKDFAVVLAAYNEEKHIAETVKSVKKYGCTPIVVSDGSKDNTIKEALKAGAIVLEHITNLGKGGAMKTGAEYAVRNGFKAIIFMDADGQHDPKELPKFMKELENVEIVFGMRKRQGSMPLILRFGNWFITELVYRLYHIRLKDVLNGYRAIRTEVYPKIVWRSLDYTVESEMIAWAGKAKLKYKEIVTKTIYYDKYKGTSPIDGIPIVWNLIMWKIGFKRR